MTDVWIRRSVIVELNGNSQREARAAASKFIENTNSARSLDAPTPRKTHVTAAALKIERARMRVKVAGTKKMRAEILALLGEWRDGVIGAVKGVQREADASGVATALNAAVDAGVLSPEQRQSMIERLSAALQSMDANKLATVILTIQAELLQAGIESGVAEVGIAWDVPPQTALEALSQTVIPFSRDVVEREIVAIQAALSDGLTAGDSIPQLAQRIQDTFDDGIHILAQGPIAAGKSPEVVRVIPSDSWAEMVARTETSRAMNAGITRAFHAAGVERVMLVAAEDERTCPICSDLDGQIAPLEGKFEDGTDADIPIHPSCRCTFVSAGVAQSEAA